MYVFNYECCVCVYGLLFLLFGGFIFGYLYLIN